MVEGPQMTEENENISAWIMIAICAVCGFSIMISDWISHLKDKKTKPKYRKGEKV